MQNSNWQNQLVSLESCSQHPGILQSLHPAVKTFFAFLFSICVSTCTGYHLLVFVPYFIILLFLLYLSHIPVKLYIKRLAIALPFSLFAGIWGCFFDTTPVIIFNSFVTSGGVIMLISIICRTLLSVGIILILVATTTIRAISNGLRYLHVPWELTLIFELIMRYIIVLFDEVVRMKTAWTLRAGSRRRLSFHDFSSLTGNLFLRSYERATRIYQAMQCRGYPKDIVYSSKRPASIQIILCSLLCLLCIAIRLFFYTLKLC